MLAAGAGRRFGGRKLITPWRGRALIEWSIAAALDSGVDGVTVVLGCDADEVKTHLPSTVQTVVCNDWAEGIAATLRCGVASLPAATSALAVFLGDMPHVSSALARELLDAVKAGAPAAVASFDGTPAHPVAIGPACFPMLRSLRGDRGARSAILSIAGIQMIKTNLAGSTFDIDVPADLSQHDSLATSAEFGA